LTIDNVGEGNQSKLPATTSLCNDSYICITAFSFVRMESCVPTSGHFERKGSKQFVTWDGAFRPKFYGSLLRAHRMPLLWRFAGRRLAMDREIKTETH